MIILVKRDDKGGLSNNNHTKLRNTTVLHTNYCTFPTEHCFLYRVKRNRERLGQPEVVEHHYQLSEKLTYS